MSIGYPIGLYRGLLLLTMYIGWRPVSLYGSTIIMNELYNETIERNGKIYHYDPDYDIYYVRYASHSFWDKYTWIAVTIVLAMVCYLLEYHRA